MYGTETWLCFFRFQEPAQNQNQGSISFVELFKTKAGTILNFSKEPEPEVLQKSQELPNTGWYIGQGSFYYLMDR
jgi:hypothetical protein